MLASSIVPSPSVSVSLPVRENVVAWSSSVVSLSSTAIGLSLIEVTVTKIVSGTQFIGVGEPSSHTLTTMVSVPLKSGFGVYV